jgi:murein DD-endopeptidase MepM/ murein hydrolase activator NlpD
VGHDDAHATFHFGIDFSAPDGTAVYPTVTGTASLHPLHADTVIVSAGDGSAHEY